MPPEGIDPTRLFRDPVYSRGRLLSGLRWRLARNERAVCMTSRANRTADGSRTRISGRTTRPDSSVPVPLPLSYGHRDLHLHFRLACRHAAFDGVAGGPDFLARPARASHGLRRRQHIVGSEPKAAGLHLCRANTVRFTPKIGGGFQDGGISHACVPSPLWLGLSFRCLPPP